jgi:hypothetical protein
LACGAGVGSGTFSAKAGALTSAPQTIAAKTPKPGMHLSAMFSVTLSRRYAARTI